MYPSRHSNTRYLSERPSSTLRILASHMMQQGQPACGSTNNGPANVDMEELNSSITAFLKRFLEKNTSNTGTRNKIVYTVNQNSTITEVTYQASDMHPTTDSTFMNGLGNEFVVHKWYTTYKNCKLLIPVTPLNPKCNTNHIKLCVQLNNGETVSVRIKDNNNKYVSRPEELHDILSGNNPFRVRIESGKSGRYVATITHGNATDAMGGGRRRAASNKPIKKRMDKKSLRTDPGKAKKSRKCKSGLSLGNEMTKYACAEPQRTAQRSLGQHRSRAV